MPNLNKTPSHPEWQPIETAPRDGSIIWLYGKNEKGEQLNEGCYFEDEGWFIVIDQSECEKIEATYWMPFYIPNPPNN